jgi:RNA polymerase sigma factor (TIGR02999 family)
VLVHEAYLRLLGQRRARWQNRDQFFAVAAQVMRRVLVDHARRHGAAKRGAGRTEQLDSSIAVTSARDVTVLALDEALTQLAVVDPFQARLIELRCFGGLTTKEAARTLAVSVDTIKREWRLGKAWLYRELNRGAGATAER